MKQVILFVFVFFALSCKSDVQTHSKQSGLDKKYPIVHMIFLNLKEEVMENDQKNFMAAIEALSEIPVVQNLSYGFYKDLRDPRSLKEYEMLIQMQFATESDYLIYQKDPKHQSLKQMGGLLLAGPPNTYHFVLE